MGRGRNWTAEDKAKIVVQGLKGRAVSEICNEYQIHQTQYYKWREQFLENVPKLFDTAKQSKKETQLEREVQKLKSIIGDLTVELKKSDW
jgi:transposase-like protein